MIARHQYSFGLFTLLVMSWAAIWCCCVTPARAESPATRPCCVEPVACPIHSSTDRDRAPVECPLVQVRQTAMAPVAAVLPTLDLTVALPAWLGNIQLPTPTSSVTASIPERLTLAAGPPTLLALHTSLVW